MLLANSSYAAVTFLKGAAVGISETGTVAGNSKFFGLNWTVGMDDAYNYDAKTGRDASHLYVPNGVDSLRIRRLGRACLQLGEQRVCLRKQE